jgi:histidine triad (HIT) family protein
VTNSCLFCDIVAGDIPAHIVFEDEHTSAFLDHRPLFPGHVLVVPRVHYDDIFDCPEDVVRELGVVTRKIAFAVRTATGSDGIFIANNNVVSQSVLHQHVHVVPRKRKDGLRGFMWPRRKYAEGEADAVATSIREAL